jgi:hypothetical protein
MIKQRLPRRASIGADSNKLASSHSGVSSEAV